MSKNFEEKEENERKQKNGALKNGCFECIGCGSVLSSLEMSSYPELCKNCNYDNDKNDRFEKD